MNHLNYEFEADPGELAEVTLDRAANVLLMDSQNYSSYLQGRAYEYDGGYATESPVQFAVPRHGHWHVVVDLGGGPGQVRASVRLLSGAPA
jgi:Domain of unknown function (DUF1883)